MPSFSLRLSNDAYEAVQKHSRDDEKSMNAWLEHLVEAEDMRRRCTAHERYMAEHPEMVEYSKNSADRNLKRLSRR
ncbi:hypothetical protein ACWDTP_26500 [Mycobacterium sp. NPDC003449]